MSPEEEALLRRLQANRQTYQQGLGRVRRSPPPIFRGIDSTQGMAIYQQGGQQRVSREMITNALVRPGDRVRVTGRGLNSWMDAVPRIKRTEVVAVETTTTPTSAVPILFTRLNAEGDREYWLGGDRDTPILLETLPRLNLITNDWSGPTTQPADQPVEINISSTGIVTESYSTTVQITIPTYVLAKITGTLDSGTPDSERAASIEALAMVGLFPSVLANAAASQIGDNSSQSAVLTDETVTINSVTGQTGSYRNRERMLLLNPASSQTLIVAGNVGNEAPGISSVNATASLEFIPCYLSATADKRFVLLQPAPGTFYYYEINAADDTFSRVEFTSPDPIGTSDEDWRSPLASYEELSFPLSVWDACENAYFNQFGGVFRFAGGAAVPSFGSNILGDRIARINCQQGGQVDKLYGVRNIAVVNPEDFVDTDALITSQDVDLEIEVSDLDPSGGTCTLDNTETVTVTARSLATPNAAILAIAPVVVEEG